MYDLRATYDGELVKMSNLRTKSIRRFSSAPRLAFLVPVSHDRAGVGRFGLFIMILHDGVVLDDDTFALLDGQVAFAADFHGRTLREIVVFSGDWAKIEQGKIKKWTPGGTPTELAGDCARTGRLNAGPMRARRRLIG